MLRARGLLSATVVAIVLTTLLATPALAAVSITRAELNGSNLRVEGRGATPNTTVTVNGGQASGTSDGSGNFRIENSSFPKPADCRVTVGDGSTSATATLSGCTVSSPPPPGSPPTLSSLTVSPHDVVGPDPATGTVTLSAAAPSGGFVVDLSSDNTAAATVPPSVTVPAGSTRATFTITTKEVTNAQSAIIIGTVGGVFSTERHDIITVWDPFHFSNGSISILFGGDGNGRVTSSPAGIDCIKANGTFSGTCDEFFPVGTIVRLDARPAADSSFLGWSTNLPGCSDPSRVRVARGTNITCRPIFRLR